MQIDVCHLKKNVALCCFEGGIAFSLGLGVRKGFIEEGAVERGPGRPGGFHQLAGNSPVWVQTSPSQGRPMCKPQAFQPGADEVGIADGRQLAWAPGAAGSHGRLSCGR